MTDRPVDPDRSGSTRPLHRQPVALAAVLVGGAAGTSVRYWGEWAFPHTGTGWPWATFVINLVGAFVLGMLLEALAVRGPDVGRRRMVRLLAGTGFCGAFTTYSTFALETVELVRAGASTTALAYAAVSVVLGVAVAWVGIVAGSALGGHR